jgi:hypothetical protein
MPLLVLFGEGICHHGVVLTERVIAVKSEPGALGRVVVIGRYPESCASCARFTKE